MELKTLQEIRKIAIISMFSDNDLMDMFTLKGGNALNIVYNINNRGSIDLDLSMREDFKPGEINKITSKLEKSLTETFQDYDYHVFDIKLNPHPVKMSPEKQDFWGGYRLEFKVITKEIYLKIGNDIEKLRRNSLVIGEAQKRTFTVDISKYEWCKQRREFQIDGYTIYVYTPIMVVYEKLRAICQQMDEYIKIVPKIKTPRARDFFDIYSILEKWPSDINLNDENNIKILKEVFEIKKVPLCLIGKIDSQREFHRDDFNSIKDTISPDYNLKDYDFYFDYVIDRTKTLQSLWEK